MMMMFFYRMEWCDLWHIFLGLLSFPNFRLASLLSMNQVD